MSEHSPRGGSFMRNPATGELTLVEETPAEPPAPEPTADKKSKKSTATDAANEKGDSQ